LEARVPHADALCFTIDRVMRGQAVVLERVGASCDPCMLHAIVGPNGAGKSTLLRALAGLERFAGTVALGTFDLAHAEPRARASRVAWVPQSPAVPEGVTVRHVVALGRVWRDEDAATRERSVVTALQTCGVEPLADRLFEELSAGQRQRVVLARAIATDAPVLLLDEPFAALDLGASLALERLLRERVAGGAIVVAALHDLTQAARIADRVTVLEAGRAVTTGSPAEALTPEVLARVWGVRPVDPALRAFALLERS
jgi:iron complex transport system ATP-binding protein